MKCPRCGSEIEAGDKVCKACGEQNPFYGDASESGSYVPSHIPEDVKNMPPRETSRAMKAILAIVRAFIYVALFFGCQILVSTVYTTALILGDGLMQLDEAALLKYTEMLTENMIMITLVSNLVTLLAVSLLQTVRRRSLTEEFSAKSVNLMRLPSFALYGLALNAIVVCIYALLPMAPELLESLDSQYAPMYEGTSVAVQILTLGIAGPIVEEVLFRGLILSRLRVGIGKKLAVLISAVLFALMHGTPLAVAYAFVLGIILGIMTLKYDSIIPAVVCHMFFNLSSYVLALFGNTPVIIVLLISVALCAYLTYSIFIRHPTFSDIIADNRGAIRPINDEEAELFKKIHALKEKDEITRDEVESLNDEWDRLRELRKNKRK